MGFEEVEGLHKQNLKKLHKNSHVNQTKGSKHHSNLKYLVPAFVVIGGGTLMLFATVKPVANQTSQTISEPSDQSALSSDSSMKEEAAPAAEPNGSESGDEAAEAKQKTDQQGSASINMSIKSTVTTTEDGQIVSSEPEVKVDGQTIDIPENGRLNQTIRDDDSTVRIRVRADSDSSTDFKVNVSN